MHIARLNSEPEIFYSLQGEGACAGAPAVFLRLAGCNQHCAWCDSKHSWAGGITLPVAELATRLLAFPCRHFVITGGEPLLQADELAQLLALLPAEAYIEIETNGTLPPPPLLAARVNQWNISPKLAHAAAHLPAPDPAVLAAFAALPGAWFKWVVQGEDDWPAIQALQLPREKIILMPCADNRADLLRRLPAVADMARRHQVRLGNRLHIILWDRRAGV
ncbi:MAG: 7-carboxy-7-deazaguanine synthase QueE [Akkermansiaceae bacterium]|nr:7-carboxy-7-deazaguanine synthase QueE [Akkermansiaceae bacterium]